jgi:hypothetical protein
MVDEPKRPIRTMDALIEEFRKTPGLAEALPPEFTDPNTDFDELYEKFRVWSLGLRSYPPEKIEGELLAASG